MKLVSKKQSKKATSILDKVPFAQRGTNTYRRNQEGAVPRQIQELEYQNCCGSKLQGLDISLTPLKYIALTRQHGMIYMYMIK